MIFYFSGTGNTLWAARRISEAIGEQLIPMTSAGPEAQGFELSDDERIGFCFPVHGWRPPALVRDFVRRISVPHPGNRYCWMLCTAGDDIGETVSIFQKDLSPTGLHVSSAFSLAMPETYVGLPFMDVDSLDKEHQKKAQARIDLERHIQIITARGEGATPQHTSHWPRINSRLLGAAFVKWLVTDKPFRVDPERCLRCGKCAEVCPVGNISGGKRQLPEWLHQGRCLTCFACYHYCPVKAIDYGRRTKNKGQYHYTNQETTQS